MALEIEIDLSELEAFAKAVDGLNEYVGAELSATMTKALAILHGAIFTRTPVDSGALRGATTKERFGVPTGTLTGEVLNPLGAQYGLSVEFGRAAGKQPPTAAIKLWVTRKLGLRGQEAESAAFLIARAIGRRGTTGAFMFRDGFNAARPQIEALYDAIPGKLLARLELG